ncbi:MAG: TerB N-terminal domain-containing protein [Ectothiorhodospiraceae bacterium]|nr:TerB N-terminal domain-containing protein [Ectothiorhodospiraceae bacterium]
MLGVTGKNKGWDDVDGLLVVVVVLIGGVLLVRAVLKAASPRNVRSGREAKRVVRRETPALDDQDDTISMTFRMSFGRPSSGERRDPSVTSNDCWVPRGEVVEVQGVSIHRGMLYVGRGLGGPEDYPEITPPLVNPALTVDLTSPDLAGESVGYWPSYDEMTPAERAGYLRFLAVDGWQADASLGYVFLYFYGLERRALHDARLGDTQARAEIPEIVATAREILHIYGGNQSVRGYVSRFIDTVSLLFDLPLDPGDFTSQNEHRFDIPNRLKRALGRAVMAGEPIDAALAQALVYTDPQIRSKVAMERCAPEFDALFPVVFRKQHGEGIKVKPNKSRIHVHYRPACRGGPAINKTLELPDITKINGPRKKIQAVVDACCEQLGALSRHRIENPGDKDSPKALALMPTALAGAYAERENGGPVEQLRARLENDLQKAPIVRLPASELLHLFGAQASSTGKVSAETRRLIERLLAGWSMGVAPGMGFTRGTLNRTDKLAIFRQENPDHNAASVAFEQALVHMRVLGLAYAHTSHALTPAQSEVVRQYIDGLNGLTSDERLRLQAVLHWLLESQTRHLAGVRKALSAMKTAEINNLLELLLRFVSVDGRVSAGCVRDLKILMPLLGEEPDTLYERLHRLIAEPQEVRSATPGRAGGRIPPPSPTGARDVGATGGEDRAPLELDHDAIAAREAESAAISETLKEIFTEDTEAPDAPPEVPEETAGLLPNLDHAHHTLLAALLAHGATVSLAEARALAESQSLLFDGAIDEINEAALDATGAALLEIDEEELLIDQEILREAQS